MDEANEEFSILIRMLSMCCITDKKPRFSIMFEIRTPAVSVGCRLSRSNSYGKKGEGSSSPLVGFWCPPLPSAIASCCFWGNI
eukprot:XP_001709185.1 Hypothetical protein GL50803_103304 [Giardia lamblia ATCC 50803]